MKRSDALPLLRLIGSAHERKEAERKILIFGVHGQIGQELSRQIGPRAVGFNRASVDICGRSAVAQAFRGAAAAGTLTMVQRPGRAIGAPG